MYKNMTTNLMVESIEETINFYKDILGFKVVTTVPGKNNKLQFAILAKDNLMLMCQEKNNFAGEYPILKTMNIKPSVSLYITVDDFDFLYETINKNHTILSDIHTTFYGSREFAIADNNGYVLTFTEEK